MEFLELEVDPRRSSCRHSAERGAGGLGDPHFTELIQGAPDARRNSWGPASRGCSESEGNLGIPFASS